MRQKGDFLNAIRLYSEEITKEGSLADTGLYFARGETYFQMKEYEKAIESYSVASSKNPSDPSASLQLAYCWYKLGDYRKARIDLRDSMRISPTINARCLSGLLHAREGKKEEALAELNDCCKKDNASYLTSEQLTEAQKTIVLLQRTK
ncbi:MAG: tetratricopeptide repeat protein [Cyanobacteria bacterium REEB67]|nr:tetratricopeptide repeat protein [Cyanobacteria bacterium REEB67]